ncbi:hypothetical protein CERZMDRAFT_96613 [Cercospora zeae-maydis SCOH1-5]|uniref:Coenzyme Q-binding protein COQ10 START domain-containing protein n=1 Tax=Cercospora zeae-maydis SCOH1-5 TaxID=717836 RepID=A0A6A6FHK6_9PEZI|nr:hypothetical protein CERZMDRAFT_96613 [Cercospora zeae-maydis SCOH1-5]
MSSDSWPPASGLTTKVVPRKDAVLQVYSSRRIAAPASLVLETLLHIENYKSWNTWIPSGRIAKQDDSVDDNNKDGASHEVDLSRMRKNSVMVFDVIMDANKPDKFSETNLIVTDISTPEQPSDYLDAEMLQDPSFDGDVHKVYRVSWATHGGWMTKGLRSERFHEIIPTTDNECEVRTWEIMGGVLAYTVKWMFQSTLQEKFELWTNDLKVWCEKQHQQHPQQTAGNNP